MNVGNFKIDVSVVVSTYNRASSLMTTLDSLRKMSVPAGLRWELILVDNNSTDDTRAVIEEFTRRSGLSARYVFEGKQGLSHARNAGIAAAKGEIIAFTDDDVMVDKDWLRSLYATFEKFDCIGVGGRGIPAWGTLTRPSWAVMEGPYKVADGILLYFNLGDQTRPTTIAPWGLNMAFRRSAFAKYGRFRTDLGVSGKAGMLGEDTEFGKRLIRAGEKIIYCPTAIVNHPVDPRRLSKRYFKTYHFNAGRSLVRIEGLPEHAICYFGVPRYKFRELAVGFIKWVTALNPSRRFHAKLQMYMCAGWIYEARQQAHQKKTGKVGGNS